MNVVIVIFCKVFRQPNRRSDDLLESLEMRRWFGLGTRRNFDRRSFRQRDRLIENHDPVLHVTRQ